MAEMDFLVISDLIILGPSRNGAISPVSQNLYYYHLWSLVIRFKECIFACSDKKTEQFIAKPSLFLRKEP